MSFYFCAVLSELKAQMIKRLGNQLSWIIQAENLVRALYKGMICPLFKYIGYDYGWNKPQQLRMIDKDE